MRFIQDRALAAKKTLEKSKLRFGDIAQIEAISSLSGEPERQYAIDQLAGNIFDTCTHCREKEPCAVCNGEKVVTLQREDLEKLTLKQIRALIGKPFEDPECS